MSQSVTVLKKKKKAATLQNKCWPEQKNPYLTFQQCNIVFIMLQTHS